MIQGVDKSDTQKINTVKYGTLIAAEPVKIKGEDDTAFSELLIKIGNSQDFQFLLIRITKYQLEKLKVKKDDKIYILFKSTSFDRQAII